MNRLYLPQWKFSLCCRSYAEISPSMKPERDCFKVSKAIGPNMKKF